MTQSAIVTGLVVREPNGQQIARADQARVFRRHESIRIDVRDAGIRVKRRADGNFNLQDLLPPEDPDAKPMTYRLEIDSVDISYQDESVGIQNHNFNLTNVFIDSVDGATFISSSIDIPDAGNLAVRGVLNKDLSWNANATVNQVDLARLHGLIQSYARDVVPSEYRSWNARQLLVDGKINVSAVAPKENQANPPKINGELSLSGSQLTVGESLRSANVSALLKFHQSRLFSELEIRESGRNATATLAADWSSDWTTTANFEIESVSTEALWPEVRTLLPQNIKAKGVQFGGSASTHAELFQIKGALNLRQVSFETESFDNVKATIFADNDRVTLDVQDSTWRGTPTKGWLAVSIANDHLAGAFQTNGAGLKRIEFPLNDQDKLLLAGNAEVLISGKTASPRADVGLNGFANLTLSNREIYLGAIESRVSWRGQTAEIKRATIEGPSGVGQVTGHINTANGTLDLEARLGGLDLAAWQDTATGVAYIDGKVTGKLESPRMDGVANIYKLQIGNVTVPAIKSDVVLVQNDLNLKNFVATMGLGEVTGDANIAIDTQTITGLASAKDLFVSDFIPGIPTVGSADIKDIRIWGKLAAPTLSAVISSDDLIVAGYEVDRVEGDIHFTNNIFTLNNLIARAGEGQLNGSGTLDIGTMATEGSLELESLPLDRVPVDRSTFDLKGNVSGALTVASQDGMNWVGQGTFKPSDVNLNDFNAGNGSFQLSLAGDIVSLHGGIGSTAGFAEVIQMSYNLTDQVLLPSEILVSNLGVAGALLTVSDKIETDNRQIRRILDTLSGTLSADLTLEGPISDILVDVKSAKVTEFEAIGQPQGEISASGSWSKDSWTLNQSSWRRGLGVASVRGSADSVKGFSLQGDLTNFDPSVATLFFEDAPEISALLTSSFILSGKGDEIEGRGTLNLRNIQVRGKNDQLVDVPVALDSQEIELTDGTISAKANVSFDGLAGQLTATIPLSIFDSEPTGKFEAEVVAEDRPVSDLEKYLSGIDLKQSAGLVKARVHVSGTTKQFDIDGTASFGTADSPGKLVFPATNTSLSQVLVSASASKGNLRLVASANSSHGGEVNADVTAGIQQVLEGNLGQNVLAEIPLNGEINLDGFKIVEKIRLAKPVRAGQPPEYAEASQASEATWSGRVTIGGNGQSPMIGGRLVASNVKAYLPPEFPPSTPGDPPVVSPIFDNLQIHAASGTELGVPNGELILLGDAFITGALDNLAVRAPLTVESGTFLLPTSRIKLEEGGTVTLIAGLGEAAPRVDVNLTGTTTVTLRQASDRYQTYRLLIEIRGDLLDPQGVNISGSSDPPDLSQEEIRAIVGQEDFIRDLVNSALAGNRQNLQEGVFSLALPSLTQGFTAELARSLKLDYLVLDYNAFDGAIIRGGKELARGLLLEASRQFSQTPGQQLKYELQLSYRPPIRDRFFSRLRFTLSQDNTVPWRVGLSWTTKF
ncbi:AsmA-like C-terminal region-containing protein [Geitlerinema splendidum]|nr:AsmA-like C-terminal region-containing protein [Geitlerinema splendidum]